jgi:hypothetical protein
LLNGSNRGTLQSDSCIAPWLDAALGPTNPGTADAEAGHKGNLSIHDDELSMIPAE